MRRRIRKRILESLHTMKEAQEIAVNMLLNGQAADAGGLLLQCQEGAQKIGESIEQSEGEGTGVISCLEEYCEILYQISQSTEERQVAVYRDQLDRILQQAEYEVKEHLPVDRLKVVFLPYKASMWDCMESVWEAADADPECEALVVPIPYYEKNGQGSIVRECYEGDLFPKDVPVVPYRAYHLEEEQPDIVYIHNPYDGGNTITTVHPDYYSSNLKKYTDLLVYIPYYICGNGPLPDCHLSLPAYEYVDKIIVQDEEKVKNLLDFVPEEKIVVLGTPKVDRIRKLNQKKDEILENGIPQEWREKIRGKKVILYNISVTGILRSSKYAMDKIRYVLSCFEGREDVVLWWRPHPLLEATLQSTLPALYGEYMEIKRAFAGSGNGILDETGDAAVAAVIADAYLGENTTSLMHYFGVLGKPVMYTNWEIVEDNKKDREFLHFNPYFREGDTLFFVPSTIGLDHDLYRMDLENGKIEKVMTFSGTPDNKWGCYWGIKKVQNKIFMAPHNTEEIFAYDIEKKQGIKLVLSESKDRMMLFDEMTEYDGKIFLLPKCYPAIVSIDVESLDICEYKECIKPFLRDDKTGQLFYWAFCKKGQYLYLASCNESRVLIFDMKDGSYEVKQIGDYSYGYYSMVYDGEYFWLGAFKDNCIVRWEERSGEIKKYIYPIDQVPEKEGYYYTPILDHGNEIIVFYGFKAKILFLDKETGKYRRPEAIENTIAKIREESIDNEVGFTYAKVLDQETVAVFDAGGFSFNIWNINTDHWKRFLCRIPSYEMLEKEKRQIEKFWLTKSTPYCLFENAVSISQFIDYIIQEDISVFRQVYSCYSKETDGFTVGRRIHEEVLIKSKEIR